jgi:hypothetical protein
MSISPERQEVIQVTRRTLMDERLIVSLRETRTRENVEDSFNKFSVTDLNEKMEYLEKAMYSPLVFYSSGENTSLEDRYELALQVFLKGSWKLQEYYAKLGFGEQPCSR